MPRVYSADGIIDALMQTIDPKYRRVGFDTRGTPFGSLTGQTSLYKFGYDDFRLQTFCDGYIFQKPLTEYEGVTVIKGFVNDSNLSQARVQSQYPSFRRATVEEFYKAALEDADIQRSYSGIR